MHRIVARLKDANRDRVLDWSMFCFGAGSLALALVMTAATLVTADTASTGIAAPATFQQN